jgi:hypothetical protein
MGSNYGSPPAAISHNHGTMIGGSFAANSYHSLSPPGPSVVVPSVSSGASLSGNMFPVDSVEVTVASTHIPAPADSSGYSTSILARSTALDPNLIKLNNAQGNLVNGVFSNSSSPQVHAPAQLKHVSELL